MAQIIDMPKLSDTMTVGTLVKWLKNEGDVVKSGTMLAEVETDKATMELESFFDGTILKIFAAPGAQVAIGAPLCAIGKPGEKVDVPAGKPAPAAAPKADAPAASDKDKPGAATTAKNEVQAQPAATPDSARNAPASEPSHAKSAPAREENERVKISPLARKLAEEKGLDPSRITGSGPGGRIVRTDVIAAEKAGTAKAGAPGSRGGPSGSLPSGPGAFARGPVQEERSVPVSNMRGAIARRLVESKTQLPHFYVEIEIDASPLLALREQLNTGLEKEGVKLSVNDFILKASAEALRRVPQVNGSWQGDKIQYFAAAHVSFAVAIEDGLITPVIRDTHLKSVFQISTEAKALGKRAKEKKLAPAEFTGGTFCVSNLGMMGIPKFSAIINPPNAAILAVGTTVKKPVVKNDQIVIGQTMTLTLSCDHRVVDGAVGAQYLSALKQLLESPALLLV
ncbi:MAG TPA: pyruvate dehydrogenase complex dihydrolipoamide acetyltransferase [Opitutaceae bacterium]|nr:pyruvate dehydrogenase complex dihydrolipoamide acetyltransferase [Opitutaceae bacterium]